MQLEDVPPACGLDVRARPERGDEQPDGRDQPDESDEAEHDVDHGVVEGGDRASRGRPGARPGERLGEDAHVTDFVRKRRTLKTMIGMSTTSMTTATADP